MDGGVSGRRLGGRGSGEGSFEGSRGRDHDAAVTAVAVTAVAVAAVTVDRDMVRHDVKFVAKKHLSP